MDGQYLGYTFFRVDPSLAPPSRVRSATAGKDAFAEVVERFAPRFDTLRAYSTHGHAAGRDFFLWKITRALRRPRRARRGAERDAARRLARDAVLVPRDDEGLAVHERPPRAEDRPEGSPYLVVYPFVKVRPWYALTDGGPPARRWTSTCASAHEFATINNHTTYSFGIDDQEFMTAFECDEPADFMHLMLRLRDSEASRYTERDTPIFVGQFMDIRAALDAPRRRVAPASRPRPASPASYADTPAPPCRRRRSRSSRR